MFGPWLLQTLLIFIGALKVAPWSVERENTISLQPLPWKSDHAAYTLPVAWSTWMPVLPLKLPTPKTFADRITVRTYREPSVALLFSLEAAHVASQRSPVLSGKAASGPPSMIRLKLWPCEK